MQPGDVVTKSDGNAHHLRKESDAPVIIVAMSLVEASTVHYPDIGKRWAPDEGVSDARDHK